ncbi:MAG TPA: TonB-dependent receptor [Gemmatimonadales bacterium]|nr:TonB-dependent receptor [Gemmatimonadales bacterium]
MESEPKRRGRLLLSCVLAGAILLARPAAAQITDTLPQDTARVDTAGSTARYLQGQRNAAVRVPLLPLLGVEGPRPAGTRLVFDRDSLDMMTAASVAEVLARVPGVYLWRGGWTGQPMPASYQGRGATAVEYELDGLPFVAVGPDSVGVDPSLLAPSLLERIEVERWPGLLRVHLFTRRHDRLAARSRIGAARGDVKLARYEAAIERRFASGLGFTIAGDYLDVPTRTGASGHYRNTQYFAQGGWFSPRGFGLQYQLFHMAPTRDAFQDALIGDTLSAGVHGSRTDMQLRASWSPGLGGPGPHADLLYGRTSWSDTTGFHQQVNQGGVTAGIRTARLSATGTALLRSRWTTLDLRGDAAWNPIPLLTARVEGRLQRHDGGRTTGIAGVQAGIAVPAGLHLTASGRVGHEVAAPAILTDPEQQVADLQILLGWERPWIGVQGGWSRTKSYLPHRFPLFLTVDSLRPAPGTDWLTVSGRLAPVQWLRVDGWFETPRGGTGPDGQPPEHLVGTATLQSKFLRAFPSGIFDLELQLGLEHWGAGTIGLDAGGVPIGLAPATFWRSHVQLALGDFVAYWSRENLSATARTYVPGFPIPGYANTFGVRWAFTN